MKQIKIAKLSFLNWTSDPKYLTVLLYLLVYTYHQFHGLNTYASSFQESITPWLFPFLSGSGSFFIPIIFSFIFLISDAPFRTNHQMFVIQRVGKHIWIQGQIFYIIFLSMLYTVFLWILSWIWILPTIEFSSDWGEVLTTAALTGGHHLFGVPVEIYYNVIKNDTPVTVTLWCMASLFSVCFLLGSIVCLCNIWMKKDVGVIIAFCLCTISVIPNLFAANPGIIRYFIWISPLSWTDRNLMGNVDQYLPSYSFGVLAPLLISGILCYFQISTIGNSNLEGVDMS